MDKRITEDEGSVGKRDLDSESESESESDAAAASAAHLFGQGAYKTGQHNKGNPEYII